VTRSGFENARGAPTPKKPAHLDEKRRHLLQQLEYLLQQLEHPGVTNFAHFAYNLEKQSICLQRYQGATI
jgi:hypothetical protein